MSLTLLTALTTFVLSPLPVAPASDDCTRVHPLELCFSPTTDEVISLGLLDQAPAAEDPVQDDSPLPFGTAGSRRVYVHGGGGLHVRDDDDTLGQLGVGLEYFIADDLSLDLELNGLYFSQVGENAFGGNFALLFRWHFIANETWSMYLDGGAGLLASTNDVPAGGSSFNFTPQAGLGVTFDVGNSSRLMAGVRWHHISNAHTYDHNPGRDSVMVYVGLSIPF